MRRSALVLAALLALAACDADSDKPASGTDNDTALTISVKATPDAEATVFELTCDPAGGDHPNPKAACTKLLAADDKIFDPTPEEQDCTAEDGGPQTATIVGTLKGKKIDSEFTRNGGCEIYRWDALGTEVFDIPLQ